LENYPKVDHKRNLIAVNYVYKKDDFLPPFPLLVLCYFSSYSLVSSTLPVLVIFKKIVLTEAVKTNDASFPGLVPLGFLTMY